MNEDWANYAKVYDMWMQNEARKVYFYYVFKIYNVIGDMTSPCRDE